MLAAERREKVLRLLEEGGSVFVSKLAALFGVSEVTIRQDLRALEKRGLLDRIYGGAVPKYRAGYESTVSERRMVAPAEKRHIAALAARLVEDGEVVALTDGTTTLEIAYHLRRRDVTIVTNSWDVVAKLGQDASMKIISLGGMLRQVTMSFTGPLTLSGLQQLRFDRLFLSVDGASVNFGFSTPHMMECEVYRSMVESAKQTIALVDHTKIGKEYMYRIATLEEVDAIIVDAKCPKVAVEEFEDWGIEVRVAAGDEDGGGAPQETSQVERSEWPGHGMER